MSGLLVRLFPCRGPVWWPRVGSRSTPRARRHSVAPWISRSRLTTVRQTALCPLTHRRSRDRRLIGLPRSETAGRRPRGHQDRDDPRHLVCQRHPHQHRRLAHQHPAQPIAQLGHVMDMPFELDAVGANAQLLSQRPFADSRGGSESLLIPRSGAARLRRLLQHRPCHSSGTARKASRRRAGSAAPHARSSRSHDPRNERHHRLPSRPLRPADAK